MLPGLFVQDVFGIGLNQVVIVGTVGGTIDGWCCELPNYDF